MLKGLIYLPWWIRRRSEPRVYDVCCQQCGWRKTIELGKVSEDSRCIHGEEPAMEIRETLPETCPKCGGRLKSGGSRSFFGVENRSRSFCRQKARQCLKEPRKSGA